MSLNILYVGQLWEGCTSLERMRTLQGLGHDVIPFDVSARARTRGRVWQSLAARLNSGPVVDAVNRDLMEVAANATEISLVWVDKGVWIFRETLRALTRHGAIAVHYTPDSQFVINRSRHLLRSMSLYDAVVTTKAWELPAYRRAGAQQIILTHQGHDDRFVPRAPGFTGANGLASDVLFVGRTEPHYARTLRTFASSGVRLKVFGSDWPKYAREHGWLRPMLGGAGLWGDAYLDALASTKIGLGLLSKLMPETSTTRSFEIPAMGTMLLAERTPEHQALFAEGSEAEFFASPEEMLEKVRFYLANPTQRAALGAAGRARCERDGYGSTARLRRVMATLPRVG